MQSSRRHVIKVCLPEPLQPIQGVPVRGRPGLVYPLFTLKQAEIAVGKRVLKMQLQVAQYLL